MKLITITIICAVSLALSGCRVTHPDTRMNRGSKDIAAVQQSQNKRTNTRNKPAFVVKYRDDPIFKGVEYFWERYQAKMSFWESDDGSWSVRVMDAKDIKEQAGDHRVWTISASKCSLNECLRMIDEGLSDFQRRRPDARVKSVEMDMHLIHSLWAEIHYGLRQRLSTLGGTRIDDMAGLPPHEVYNEIQRVLGKSSSIKAIRVLLGKHGINVQSIGIDNPLFLKPSLDGQKWSHIAKRPDVGIGAPGIIGFWAAEDASGDEKPGK